MPRCVTVVNVELMLMSPCNAVIFNGLRRIVTL